MRTEDFDYDLPPDLIAQTPLPRGESRLLILHRDTGEIELNQFPALLEYMRAGDTLVLNDSRVTARRLRAVRPSGADAELLLLRPIGEVEWEALVRPGRSLKPGTELSIPVTAGSYIRAEIVESTAEGGRLLRFADQATRDQLAIEGVAPLPPYIHETLADEERYQTVYSGPGGSAAAPTAGLHFTQDLLAEAERRGIRIATVTLHVGMDTFRPVKVEDASHHVMHGEWFTVDDAAARIINETPGRVVAVGTTTVRVLESAADRCGNVRPQTGVTRLFITPGYEFKIIDALLTNFHLPKSTLLMLVSAFVGREKVMKAYQAAMSNGIRFYSFGDAMLIV